MELIAKGSEVVTGGVMAEQKFGVKNLGMVLLILREKLYSDKIGSIAREVMSNARDAHREVGRGNIAIEVVLPTELSPQFIVRDFGPGISPDRMANVFLNYAESTKRGDNTQTGGFGLGAKTPFAYTDNFHINTIAMENGIKVKRCYVAYIDESQCGSCVEVENSVVTDENISTGTEIVVTMLSTNMYNDTRAFRTSALSVGKYWKVQPKFFGISASEQNQYNMEVDNIVNGKSVLFTNNDALTPELKNVEWSISNDRSYGNSHSIILDGIHYPLADGLLNNEVRQAINEFNDTIRFVVHFNVGELTPTVSREALDIVEKNKVAVSNRIQAILNEYNANIMAKIENSQTYFEALGVAQKYVQILSYRSRQGTDIENFSWQGRTLTQNILSVIAYSGEAGSSKVRAFNNLPMNPKAVYIRIDSALTPTKFHDNKFRELHPEHASDIVYYYSESSVPNIEKRIELAWLPNHFIGSTMFRTRKSPVNQDFLARITLYKFNGYKFERASAKEYTADKTRKVYVKLETSYNNEKVVVLTNGVRGGEPKDIFALLTAANATLYGVYSKDVIEATRVQEKMSDAEYISDFVVEEVMKSNPNILEDYVVMKTVQNESSMTNLRRDLAEKLSSKNLGHLFSKYVTVQHNSCELIQKLSKLTNDRSVMAFFFDKKVQMPTVSKDTIDLYSVLSVEHEIIVAYPMLKVISYISENDMNIVIDYVQQMNEKHAATGDVIV